jgi:TatD DNase family protein
MLFGLHSMIDSHCHIYLDTFQGDLNDVLDRAWSAGITDILMPSIDFQSIGAMSMLEHPWLRFHRMAGIHPCEIKKFHPNLYDSLMQAASPPGIVAVGETGLDYYWSTEYIDEQKQSLRMHCKVAKELKKPLVLHNRESTSDLLKIVEDEQDGSLTGVWHCFNGSPDDGMKATDLGLYLGIGGVITYKNAGVYKTVAKLPLNRLLIETDAPFLAPVPYRGKRNEPSYIKFVAEKLAGAMNITFEDVEKVTTSNTRHLFGLNDFT